NPASALLTIFMFHLVTCYTLSLSVLSSHSREFHFCFISSFFFRSFGLMIFFCSVFFFFQAEDGIRDWSVTGVQTCALPIWSDGRSGPSSSSLPSADGFDSPRHIEIRDGKIKPVQPPSSLPTTRAV